MDALAPLAKVLIPIATDIFDVLNSLLMPALSAIGSVLNIALMPLRVMWDLFMAIAKPIAAITGAIMENISKPLATVSEKLEPLMAKFTELKDKIMEGIAPILPVFSFIGELLGTVIGGAIDVLVGAFSILFDFVFGGIDMISGFLQTYLVEPIMSFISTIQSGWEMVKGFFGMGGEEAGGGGETQSVNDGVMQNGQVISTDPADFLIASKNPSALAGQIGGGDGGGTAALVSSLIAEMQGMRADLAAGKIAVNIDGQRMNAKIAANAVRNPIS
jgi:phage-related protein